MYASYFPFANIYSLRLRRFLRVIPSGREPVPNRDRVVWEYLLTALVSFFSRQTASFELGYME